MTKRILAILAYVIPTFPLGYLWHITIFADYYRALNVYRENIFIPSGVASMMIQGVIWSILYERLFFGAPILKGACRFAVIACPLAWSYMVLAASAKHQMSSMGGYLLIETAFVCVHFAVVSPLIAAVYARRN